ncbi:MAG: HEAT repeat domain-containing protein, partial [Candidatus Muiribacteriota bacterium]
FSLRIAEFYLIYWNYIKINDNIENMNHNLNEYFQALSSADWKERKKNADEISVLLNNTFTRLDKLFLLLKNHLEDGNEDSKYWITEILSNVDRSYIVEFLLELLISDTADKELIFHISRILKKHVKKYCNIYKKYYLNSNDNSRYIILKIFEDSYLSEMKNFYCGQLKDKYWKIRLKALELYSEVASPVEITEIHFLINDENVYVYKKYIDIITRLEIGERFNFKKLCSHILNNMSQKNIQKFSRMTLEFKTFNNINDFFNSLTEVDNYLLFLCFRLLFEEKNFLGEYLKELPVDDRLVFWYVYSLRNSDKNYYEESLVSLLERNKHKMITEIILDTVILKEIRLASDILELIFNRFRQNSIYIKLLNIASKQKDEVLIPQCLSIIDECDNKLRLEIVRYIGNFKNEIYIPHLIKRFDDSYWPVRKYSAGVLIDWGKEVVDYLKEFLNSENSNKSFWSTYVYINLITEENLSEIEILYKKNNINLKKIIIRNVAKLDSLSAVKFLKNKYEPGEPEIIREILHAALYMQEQKSKIYPIVKKHINISNEANCLVALLFVKKFFKKDLSKFMKKIPEKKVKSSELKQFLRKNS